MATVTLQIAPTTAQETEKPCFGLTTSMSSQSTLPNLQAGEVIGKGPSYFLNFDDQNCLTAPLECTLPETAYLVAGNPVVIVSSSPGFWCVTYAKQTNSPGIFSGWMPKDRIRIVQPDKSNLRSWAGKWSENSNTVTITIDKGALHVTGIAYWQFPNGQGENDGEIDDSGTPSANSLDLSDNDDERYCVLRLLRMTNILVIVDNTNCGGQGVTFTGIYIRNTHV